ncbi:hypothetical protein W59_11351 [Rhodococcus opacus RKJ300 = JCM 13270]|uniref:Low molecular weight antigen MTB12-like C-terminal domain-containing protein n=1 Tax=Rhodococcus opacus RKJ300 = JCM 13270 TaxID=1165867 RepID=I0WTW3_RHOOP|nr:hypothetical protein W59_11351 [Rhodococcus opacus RKJ300 = JCM 13270]QQZ18402.1 hypothetical protein GO592_40120 [Rhodococcus sp. 21391]
MTSRLVPALLTGAAVTAGLLSGCGSDSGGDASESSVGEQSTSFAAAAPEVSATADPTPAELTALVETALDYDVRLADRVKLFQGESEYDPALAQRFVQEKLTVEFTSVTSTGEGEVSARGQVAVDGNPPGDVGPVTFVAEDGTWKIARSWACPITGAC